MTARNKLSGADSAPSARKVVRDGLEDVAGKANSGLDRIVVARTRVLQDREIAP